MSTTEEERLCVHIAETFLNCVIRDGLDHSLCRETFASLHACCAKQGLVAIKLSTETESGGKNTASVRENRRDR